jgi:hypothetical protein
VLCRDLKQRRNTPLVASSKIPTNQLTPPQPPMDQRANKLQQTDIKLPGATTRDQRAHLLATLPKVLARGG